jgi:hypothetical protein
MNMEKNDILHEDGVIYITITSDGTTGPEWVKRLEGKGFDVRDSAKRVLDSEDFKPTNDVTIEIAILKGMLFKDDNRITKNIRAEADKRKLIKPNAEAACLIREKFTDEEIKAMGLRCIVVMHESFKGNGGYTYLLCADSSARDNGLVACIDENNDETIRDEWWQDDDGFAFVVPPPKAI